MSGLAGLRALVTGATGDIGLAIAAALAQAGAEVHAVGRRPDRLALVAQAGATPHAVDLTQDAALQALLSALGPINIVVLGAADSAEMAPFLANSLDTMREVMETNFFSAARLIHVVLPGMVEREWGRVIAISSLAASIGEAHGPSYCASKAALDGLLRNLAIDYSPAGVTFNTIEPGPVLTERFNRWGATKARRMAMAAAVRRLGTPEDIAAAVCFFASPGAGFVTGESLRVDGGMHLGNPMAAMYIRESSRAKEDGGA